MTRGSISVKSVIFVVVVLLVIVLAVLGVNTAKTYLSSAAGGSEPIGVKSEATDKSVTITWTTDKPTLSRIQYGTTPVSMLLQSDLADASEPKLDHEVTINSLKSGQTYYFRIKTGEDLYDNGGIPFSFKTKSMEGSAVTSTPTLTSSPAKALPTTASSNAVDSVSCAPGSDYNKDGVVNSLDIVYCQKSTINTGVTCAPGVDYNKDGAINSLDIVYCQKSK